MSIKKRNGKLILDTIWPDGVRTRKAMPELATAKKLDLRIAASKVDGSWKGLRQSLNLDKSANVGTVNDLIARYLVDYCETNNRGLVFKKSRCKEIGKWLGNVPIDTLGKGHISMLVARRKREGVKTATVNRDLAVLLHMTKWAVEQGITDHNPLADVRKIKEDQWEGRMPTREAISSVFAKLPAQVVPFFTFLYETGCRREEAILLKRQDVDVERGSATFFTTKSGRPRTVLLTKEAIAAVNSMPRLPNVDNVFYNPVTLRKWFDCSATWQRARSRAGYAWLRIHDLRRFFGIRLAESGCPMHVIQSALGHSSVSITEKYYAKFSPAWAGRVALEHLKKSAVGY